MVLDTSVYLLVVIFSEARRRNLTHPEADLSCLRSETSE